MPAAQPRRGTTGHWQLSFGPVQPGLRWSDWTHLRVGSVLPRDVLKVAVRGRAGNCFELTTRLDLAGRASTAGDMLQAINRMDGRSGMDIGLQGLDCLGPETVVELELAAHLPPARVLACRLWLVRPAFEA